MTHSANIFIILISVFTLAGITGCRNSDNGNRPAETIYPESSQFIEDTEENKAEEEQQQNILASNTPEEMERFMKESDDSDKYSEGIIPDILKESADYAYRLLKNEHNGFIVVDKSRMKVILFDKYGRMEKTYGMACAKNYGTKHKKGDSCTPEGFFSVEGTYDSTDWLFTDDDGVTSEKKGQFGPRFIRLSIPGTSQIGIHGTCAPWSIGNRSSHGCIRIKNENILELVELVEKGMPVIVVPGRKDMEQNMRENVEIAWIPTVKGAKRPIVKLHEEVKTETDSTLSISNDSISLHEERVNTHEQTDSLQSEDPKSSIQ